MVNDCVILHNMKNGNFKWPYLTHYERCDLENGHIFAIITMMSAGRQMTLDDMISKCKMHYLHYLHGHIFYTLSNIAMYGKTYFQL